MGVLRTEQNSNGSSGDTERQSGGSSAARVLPLREGSCVIFLLPTTEPCRPTRSLICSVIMQATSPKENKKESPKGGFFKPSTIILIALAVFLGSCYREYQRKNWFNVKPLQKEQFQSHPFTVLEVPTTYYKVGEIGKVLKGWHKGKGLEPYIHLYRPDPNGPKFEFDLNKLQAKAQFERFDENCTVLESVICKTCVFMNDEDHVIMNVTEIYKKPTYYYSAFAKLDNMEAIAHSLTAIGIPDVDPKKMILEHAFAGEYLLLPFFSSSLIICLLQVISPRI